MDEDRQLPHRSARQKIRQTTPDRRTQTKRRSKEAQQCKALKGDRSRNLTIRGWQVKEKKRKLSTMEDQEHRDQDHQQTDRREFSKIRGNHTHHGENMKMIGEDGKP